MVFNKMAPELFSTDEEKIQRIEKLGLITIFSAKTAAIIKDSVNQLLQFALRADPTYELMKADVDSLSIILCTFPAILTRKDVFSLSVQLMNTLLATREVNESLLGIRMFITLLEGLKYLENNEIEFTCSSQKFVAQTKSKLSDLQGFKALRKALSNAQDLIAGKQFITTLNLNDQSVEITGHPREFILEAVEKLYPENFQKQLIKNPLLQSFLSIELMSAQEVRNLRNRFKFEINMDRKKLSKDRDLELQKKRNQKDTPDE